MSTSATENTAVRSPQMSVDFSNDVVEIRRTMSGLTERADYQLVLDLLSLPEFEKPHGLTPLQHHRSIYDRLIKLTKELPSRAGNLSDPSILTAVAELTAINDPSLCVAALIHYGLCIGSLVALGKGNLRAERYVEELASGRRLGAFMISELGGGNSQLATRTRAEYDPATHEFIINTPDDAGIKIGNVCVNHLNNVGILCARLVVGGSDCGVFGFAVDLSTPQGPLPGVRLSAPMEMPLVPFDYGLVAFDEVRIPFDAWLSDGASIDRGGQFLDPLQDTNVRLARTLTAAQNIWAPASIALAAVTRTAAAQALHFSANRKSMARVGREVPLLEYTTQHGSLLRALASSYIMTCLANDAARDWGYGLSQRSQQGAKDESRMMWAPWSATNRKLALVKAVTARMTEEVITECRQHCGVAGVLLVNRFLDYLGLGQVFNDASGNNFLILLDSARMLASGAISPTTSEANGREWADVSHAIGTLRAREHRLISELSADVEQGTQRGLDSMDVWNPLLARAREAAEAHGLSIAIDAAILATNECAGDSARELLRELTTLFVFDRAHHYSSSLLMQGLVDAQQVALFQTEADRLCEKLLPQVDKLIIAFRHAHAIVRSPIGDPTQDYATALARRLGMPPASHNLTASD